MSGRSLRPRNLEDLRRRLVALVCHEPVRRERVVEAMQALERLDAGHYGICVECDCRIPQARLEACPEAARCVECQSRQDRYLAA